MAGAQSIHLDGDAHSYNKNFRLKDVTEQEASKRLAQQGQWRTPPLPAFASCSYGTAPVADQTNIPTTPDEYARMLKEAYKKGAEAGARAQQPMKQTREPMVVGLPLPPTVSVYSPSHGTAEGAMTRGNPVVPSIQASTANCSLLAVPSVVPSNSSGDLASIPVSHSKSLPDMSSYQVARTNGNEEDDKRKKRLARNRASARLRRLKKKNLVDSYEGEVGILESALLKLRSHRWGSDAAEHDALFEALSMERGQQPLTPEKRCELVQIVVAQQREQVDNLLECQLENWLLCNVANGHGNQKTSTSRGFIHDSLVDESNHDGDLTRVASEIKSILHLTAKQMSLINESSVGCTHEVQDLLTVGNCLQSIHANKWLLDEGVDEVAGQFTSVLNPTQLSKFLLWADHNAEPIDKLDYVNAFSGVGNGPTFEFGVDEGLADGDS